MANPVSGVMNAAKSNLTPMKVIGLAVGMLAVLAIADAAGITNAVLFPVTTAKAKFAAMKSK
jgi:hypothetical protein